MTCARPGDRPTQAAVRQPGGQSWPHQGTRSRYGTVSLQPAGGRATARRQLPLPVLLAVCTDAIGAHAGRAAAFAHLSLHPAVRVVSTGGDAAPVSGVTREVPVTMPAGPVAMDPGV